MGNGETGGGWTDVGVEAGEAMGVFVVGGFEEFGGALGSHHGTGGKDLGRVPGGGEAEGDLRFESIDGQATADGGTGSDRGVEAGNPDHGIADRGTGIESDAGEVHEFGAAGVAALAGAGMGDADQGDHRDAPAMEGLGDFYGNHIASAGGDHQGAVLGGEIEVAEDAFSEAGDVFEEHGLALAVGADHQVMEREGEFDDGIETGEGTVTRPEFLDEDAGVAGTEDVHHAPGEDGGGEEIGGLVDQGQLGFHGVEQGTGVVQVGLAWGRTRRRGGVGGRLDGIQGRSGLGELTVSGGAPGAGPFAELGADDFDPVPGGSPFDGVEAGAKGLEEGVAGFGDAAAEDDTAGVEQVDQGGDGGGQGAHRAIPNGLGFGIALVDGSDEVAGGVEAVSAARRQRAVADGILEGAGGANDVEGAFGIKAEVPDVAGAADGAVEESAAGEDGAADAGAEGDEEGVGATAGGTLPGFAEEGGVGVIEDGDRALEEVGPIEVFQAGEATGHVSDGAAISAGQAGGGEADGGEVKSAGFLVVDPGADAFRPGGVGRGTMAITGGEGLASGEGVLVGWKPGQFDLGATEIDAEGDVTHGWQGWGRVGLR